MPAFPNRTLCVGAILPRPGQPPALGYVPVPANLPRFIDAGDGTVRAP